MIMVDLNTGNAGDVFVRIVAEVKARLGENINLTSLDFLETKPYQNKNATPHCSTVWRELVAQGKGRYTLREKEFTLEVLAKCKQENRLWTPLAIELVCEHFTCTLGDWSSHENGPRAPQPV